MNRVYSAGPTPFYSRGPILGRNPDKSFKIFPPCYSQPPILQLWLQISISSNSRNLLKFLQLSYFTLWKEKNLIEHHTIKPYPLPYGLETSSLRTLKIMPRNLNEIVRSLIRHLFGSHENLYNHNDRQAHTRDTVLANSREMRGRAQTLPWWLGGDEVKTKENKIHWSPLITSFHPLIHTHR